MKTRGKTKVYIGTSGWHYDHWIGTFYPTDIKGYDELRYISQHFNTVENNSSFYRIAGESTYKTWDKNTPKNYKFSMKLNRLVTHLKRLELTPEVKERIQFILTSTQVLGEKLGAMVVQLPPSLKIDVPLLKKFLTFFTKEVRKQKFPFDIAIEFRHKSWFDPKVYKVLEKFNVALVSAQSSRFPESKELTADFAYIRLHGPDQIFASRYSIEQLEEWAAYIRKISKKVDRIYIYFNNDIHNYALVNGKELQQILSKPTK